MEQLNIFQQMYEEYKINNKNIRLIQLFAGYGSQALALKYLGVKFEHYKICEWALNSIIAYADLHRDELTHYGENFCGDLSKEQIAQELFNYGVSLDYNKPATLEQLKRVKEDRLRLCYNAIWWTNNLVDISKIKGTQMNVVERERFTYILTYSFPCQDLSLAGKRAGMEKGSGTRSGLLWEVERILEECKVCNDGLPQILLLENVTQIHSIGNGNNEHFKKWLLKLEELGYQNYWNDMTAVDYGIPQTRNRTFMISILGDYNYIFSKKTKLKLRLKDLLEKEVDEKYYLSNKMKKYILNRTPLGDKGNFAGNLIGKECEKSAGTITTKGCSSGTSVRGSDTLIIENMTQEEINEKIYLKPKFAEKLLIKNATKKGYLEADNGDGIVEKEESLKKELCNKLINDGMVEEGDIIKHSYTQQILDGNKKCVERNDGCMITLTTRGDTIGVVVKEEIKPKVIGGIGEMKSNGGTQYYQQDRIYDENCAIAVTTSFNPNYQVGLRIRKLTPKECFRLMGMKDEDFVKIMEHQTDSSGYHLAGDSIVTTCLMAIFGQLLDIDWQEKFKPEEWWNK